MSHFEHMNMHGRTQHTLNVQHLTTYNGLCSANAHIQCNIELSCCAKIVGAVDVLHVTTVNIITEKDHLSVDGRYKRANASSSQQTQQRSHNIHMDTLCTLQIFARHPNHKDMECITKYMHMKLEKD